MKKGITTVPTYNSKGTLHNPGREVDLEDHIFDSMKARGQVKELKPEETKELKTKIDTK